MSVVLGLGLLGSQQVQAGPQVDEAVDSPVRSGLMLGLSIGRGSIEVQCESCAHPPNFREALSVAGHVGYMVTPRLALLAEHWSIRHSVRGGAWFDDGLEHLVAQRISAVAMQTFVTDSLWLKAGLGVGYHISDGDYAREQRPRGPQPVAARTNSSPPEEDSGIRLSPAYFAAIGWEFARNESLAVEVQLRVATTRSPEDQYQVFNTGLNFGVGWY